MDSREHKHRNRHRLCYKCDQLQESDKEIYKFEVWHRGYGSIYDNYNFTIQLCSQCALGVDLKWFNEEPEIIDGYYEKYKYEEKIEELIDSFPIENQEYVRNDFMGRQDWIDMKLGKLPDEKYKEYGFYSPSQINAYREKFPTCNHPIDIIYNGESKGCKCVFGAYGEYGQKADEHNVSDECYNCKHYVKRYEPRKEMIHSEFEEYQRYYIGKLNYLKFKDEYEK